MALPPLDRRLRSQVRDAVLPRGPAPRDDLGGIVLAPAIARHLSTGPTSSSLADVLASAAPALRPVSEACWRRAAG